MFRRTMNILGSAKTAQVLMTVWLGLIVAWVIPLQFFSFSAEWTKHVVYRTPPFLAVYALLALSTASCMVRRLSRLPRRIAWRRPGGLRGKPHVLELPFDEGRARRALARCGFRRTVVTGVHAWGLRNPLGPAGNVLLHVGIVVVMAGGAVSALPDSTFVARARVTQGETFAGGPDDYFEAVHETRLADAPRLDAFTVERVDAAGVPGLPPDSLRVTVVPEGRSPVVLSASTPWVARPDTLVAVEDFSFTPQLSLIPSGSVTPIARVAPQLRLGRIGDEEAVETEAAGERYRIGVRMLPGSNVSSEGEGKVLASLSLRQADGGWRLLSEAATLTPGSTMTHGAMRVRLDGVRPSAVFRVARTPAAPLVALGIFLGALGVLLRLVFPRTEVSIVPQGEVTAVTVEIDAYRDGGHVVRRLADAWRKEAA